MGKTERKNDFNFKRATNLGLGVVFFASLLLGSLGQAYPMPIDFPGMQPLPGAAQGEQGNFSNAAGSRGYTVYVPSKLAEHPGLLVVLHGCLMTGDQMANGTLMNQKADEHGFVVLYPEQTYGDNIMKCWNWFEPENQKHASGELSILAEMATSIVQKYNLDASRVYVTGLSAGAAMASNLLGCYSDVFAGGLIASGLEFAAAQDQTTAQQVTSTGPHQNLQQSAEQAYACSPRRSKVIPVIIVHGTTDGIVNPINGERTAEQFEDLNTLIYTGAGGSADQITHSKKHLAGDGSKLTADETDMIIDGQVVVRKIIVQQMGHAWSGGQMTVPYMESRGPNAGDILVEAFF